MGSMDEDVGIDRNCIGQEWKSWAGTIMLNSRSRKRTRKRTRDQSSDPRVGIVRKEQKQEHQYVKEEEDAVKMFRCGIWYVVSVGEKVVSSFR